MKFFFALLVLISVLNVFAKSPLNWQLAEKDLKTSFKNPNFKQWEDEFEIVTNTDDQTSETRHLFSDCNEMGCEFSSSAAFEITMEGVPPGGGSCNLSGKFKFLSPKSAVAWAFKKNEEVPEFTSLLKDLPPLRNIKDYTLSRLIFTINEDSLMIDPQIDEIFCVRNTPEFETANRVKPTFKTGFNCNKASSITERTICSNEELAKLDLKLSASYASSKKDNKKQTQLQFLNNRNKCGSDSKCLKKIYENRLKYF